MPEASEGFNPLDNWNKLIDNAVGGYPATQVIARAAQNGKEDTWVALIDRLWEANPYSTSLPIDPGDTLNIFQKIWLDALKNPLRVWSRYGEFVQQYTQLMTTTTLKFWGLGKDTAPLIEPEKGDKRFSFPDWQQNPVFDAIKQSYLLTADTMLKVGSDIEGLDERQQRTVMFYLRQTLDALSPTNYVATNPQVLHENDGEWGSKSWCRGCSIWCATSAPGR